MPQFPLPPGAKLVNGGFDAANLPAGAKLVSAGAPAANPTYSATAYAPTGSAPGRFFRNLIDEINPVPGIEQLVEHPIETGKNLANAQGEQFEDAWHDLHDTREMPGLASRLSSAFGHTVAGLLPIVGPAAAAAGEQIGSGDIAGGLGSSAGLIGSMFAPRLVDGGVRTAGRLIAKPASPIAESAMGVRAPQRLNGALPGRGILEDTRGLKPATIHRSAQAKVDELNADLERMSRNAGRPLYHGTGKESAVNIRKAGFLPTKGGTNVGTGVSLTPDEAMASDFAKGLSSRTRKLGSEGEVLQAHLAPNAKLATPVQLNSAIAAAEKRGIAYPESVHAAQQDLSKQGYDGVERADGSEMRVWNTQKLRLGTPNSRPSLEPARAAARNTIGAAKAANSEEAPHDIQPMLDQLTTPRAGFAGATEYPRGSHTPISFQAQPTGIVGFTGQPVTHIQLVRGASPEPVIAAEQAPLDLLHMKRQFSKDFIDNWNPNRSSNQALGTARQMYHAMDEAHDRAVPGASAIDQRIQNLMPVIDRSDVAARTASGIERALARIARPTGALAAGLTGLFEGGKKFGIPGALLGGAAGLAAPEVLSAPAFQMGMARGLYRTGRGLVRAAPLAGATLGNAVRGGALIRIPATGTAAQ